MQSGRHQRRLIEPQTIEVDGYELTWEKRHLILPEGRRQPDGLSLSVWMRPGRTKELILDVLFEAYGLDGLPNPERGDAVLREAVRSALGAGWDPEARGGAFRHTPAPA